MASGPRNVGWAIALLLSTTVFASAAQAPPDTLKPSAADKETARVLMDDGDAKLGRGDLPGALKSYRNADRIMGVPSTGIEVGRVLTKLHKLVEARDVLLRVGRYPQRPGEPKAYVVARDEATRLAAALATRIPTLVIEPTGASPGSVVTVMIDGEQVAAAGEGIPRRLNPGQHQVTARAPGYRRTSMRVRLNEGANKKITLALEREPHTPLPPPAASHTTPAPAPATGRVPPPSPVADPGDGLSLLVPIGFITGGVGLLTGVITGTIALTATSSLDDSCVAKLCSIDQQSAVNGAVALSHVSTVGFALAGAGAAVGIIGLFTGGDSRLQTSGLRVRPLVGPAALWLEGAY